MFGVPPHVADDDLIRAVHEERPPESPLVAAFKRMLWLLLSLLIILSLLAPLLAPIFYAWFAPKPRPPGLEVWLVLFAG